MSTSSKQTERQQDEKDKPETSKDSEAAQELQTLSIIVHRGEPIDAPSTRHTAFLLEVSDPSNNVIAHVTGASGFFSYEEWRGTYPPAYSNSVEQRIPVQTFSVPAASTSAILDVFRGILVNNSERSWNCQSFVGDGLQALQRAGFLSSARVEEAVERMVDVVLAAPDED